MTAEELYNAAVKIIEKKFIPLFVHWGWGVRERENETGKIWVISNPAGDRHESIYISKFSDGIRLESGRQRRFISVDEYRSDNANLQLIEKFLRKVTEKAVIAFAWRELSPVWSRKGKSLFAPKDRKWLTLEFSFGKRTWCWKMSLFSHLWRAWGAKGCLADQKCLAIVRHRHEVNPVDACKQIVEVYESLSSL